MLYNTNSMSIFHFHSGRYHIVVYVLWPYAIPICISVLYWPFRDSISPPPLDTVLARIYFMTSPIFRIEHTELLWRNRKISLALELLDSSVTPS